LWAVVIDRDAGEEHASDGHVVDGLRFETALGGSDFIDVVFGDIQAMSDHGLVWVPIDFVDGVSAEDFDSKGFRAGGFQVGGGEVLNRPIDHFLYYRMIWVVVLGLAFRWSHRCSGDGEQDGSKEFRRAEHS
jgi:hypothetical protein